MIWKYEENQSIQKRLSFIQQRQYSKTVKNLGTLFYRGVTLAYIGAVVVYYQSRDRKTDPPLLRSFG